jgi:hypothetical protein
MGAGGDKGDEGEEPILRLTSASLGTSRSVQMPNSPFRCAAIRSER